MTAPRSSGDLGSLPPGTHVGHYSIIEKLGEGGEAIVYRARDLLLERDVALKTPRCEYASPDDCAHLLKEARAASRLSHPHIVPIHEVFEEHGRPWFAMDLVEGSTLRVLLAERRALPCEDVARYGEMLAGALHAAHAKHILHRDVTPGNIFVTPDGRLLLADFGLARMPAPPDAATAEMSVERAAGTLGYMSPEQMMGRPVGPQSDIFSAGVVLYQMATGERPFPGQTLGEVLDATLNRPLPPMSRRADVPAELEHVVRKALARRLDERYASAEDMFIDLRALRRQLESASAEPAAMPARSGWRRRATPALAAVAVVGALAAAGGMAWRTWPRSPLPRATPHQITAASGWEAEAKISPDGSDVVYAAEGTDGNIDIWLVDARGGNPIRLTDDLAPDRNPAWFADGSAIVFESERDGVAGVWKLPRLGGQAPMPVVSPAKMPAISPDGKRIAFTRPDAGRGERIAVAPLADTGNAKVLTTDRDGLWDHQSPAWSPDGRTICYSTHTDLWVVPADGGRASRLTQDGESDAEPAWGADGRWIYFSSKRAGTTAIWRVRAGGGTPERVTMGSGPERQPSVSRDGSRLTYSTFRLDSNLVVRVEKTGKEFEFGGDRRELSPTLAPDGSAVVYISDQAKSAADLWIQPLSPDGSPAGPARRLTDQPGSAQHPSYSPDGRWIAYYRVIEGQRDIWIMTAGGDAPIRFTDDPAVDMHPAWSPDGRQIAFVSERSGGTHIWIAPVADGRATGSARPLTSGPLVDWDPSWSPDGTTIAYTASDAAGNRDVWLVDAQARTPARRLTRGAQAVIVEWGALPGQLLVSGTWGRESTRLMAVDAASGRTAPVGAPLLFGRDSDSGEFATSRDGRLLVLVRDFARGDIWTMEAVRGRY
jgi:Tol biopolymer transport system component/tRNA A-37 threonylcarbamoyl transferase component Bud32